VPATKALLSGRTWLDATCVIPIHPTWHRDRKATATLRARFPANVAAQRGDDAGGHGQPEADPVNALATRLGRAEERGEDAVHVGGVKTASLIFDRESANPAGCI
jgi:hypothetical protein